ncbi:MAG TPA: hypothetical protein VFF01_11730 [Candidatus Deferrimicrobiaceae bacterium]|nr:hypothetical protein [Candidatus Deferrimicrobiaceae bacterium]
MSELFILGFLAIFALVGQAGAAVPPIDGAPRVKTETATFALG